jgi:hypothetical protein
VVAGQLATLFEAIAGVAAEIGAKIKTLLVPRV